MIRFKTCRGWGWGWGAGDGTQWLESLLIMRDTLASVLSTAKTRCDGAHPQEAMREDEEEFKVTHSCTGN